MNIIKSGLTSKYQKGFTLFLVNYSYDLSVCNICIMIMILN